MNVNDIKQSKYIKAADLQGQERTLTISNVVMENVGREDAPENKAVVYFQGAQKGMVLNITNLDALTVAYGEETDLWIGKPVTLFTVRVMFQGQMVDGLRVRAPSAPAQHIPDPLAGPPMNQQHVESENPKPFDDEVPFAPEFR